VGCGEIFEIFKKKNADPAGFPFRLAWTVLKSQWGLHKSFSPKDTPVAMRNLNR